MADPPPNADTGDGDDMESDRGSTTATPRWRKVLGIIILVLVLAMVVAIIVLISGGPGGHTPPFDHGAP